MTTEQKQLTATWVGLALIFIVGLTWILAAGVTSANASPAAANNFGTELPARQLIEIPEGVCAYDTAAGIVLRMCPTGPNKR